MIEAHVETHRETKIVLDLRYNLGGDNTTYGPMLEFVRRRASDRRNSVVVLIGRGVFSAGMNLATEIRPVSAVSYFDRALAIDPTDFPSLYGATKARTRLGRCDEAAASAERYRE